MTIGEVEDVRIVLNALAILLPKARIYGKGVSGDSEEIWLRKIDVVAKNVHNICNGNKTQRGEVVDHEFFLQPQRKRHH